MPGQIGPELADVDVDLTQVGDADLASAATALTTLVPKLETLLKSGDGEDNPFDIELHKGDGELAHQLRQLGTHAVQLAEAVEEAEEIDMGKVLAEVNKLASGFSELHAEFSKADGDADVDDDMFIPTVDDVVGILMFLADVCSEVANDIAQAGVIKDAFGTRLSDGLDKVQPLADAYELKPGDIELPEALTKNEASEREVADATCNLLKDVATRAAAMAKMASGELSDVAKKEIGMLRDIIEAAKSKIPTSTQKGREAFGRTLSNVAERALVLAQKSEGLDDEDLQRQMTNTQDMLELMLGKYADVAKASDVDMGDLGLVLGADKFLSEFEKALRAKGLLKDEQGQADDDSADSDDGADGADGTTGDDGGNGDDGAGDAGGTDDADTDAADDDAGTDDDGDAGDAGDTDDGDTKDETIKQLTDQIKQMGEQLQAMQAQLAKAAKVPPAASQGSEGGDDPDPLLFPMNYNSPAYREALAKRDKGKQDNDE